VPHLRRACEIMGLFFRRLDEDPGEGEEEGGEGGEGAGSEGAGASSAARGSGAMEFGSSAGGGADAVAAAAAATAAAVPSLASRLSTAKMCMEVELWPEAADVLDRMLVEDDTDMEVWFLLGEALLHSGDVDAALETVETAAAMVAAAIAAQPGKAGGRSGAGAGAGGAALAAAAAAARTAAVDFSREAIQALISTPPKELAAQATQFESLRAAIAKAKEALSASAQDDM
jgi:tetratricopeptide (TPR) repeat protein